MNSKLKAVLIAVLAVAVLVGAWFLYRSLSASYKTDAAMTAQTEKSSAAETQSGSAQTSAAPSAAANPAADFTVYDADGNKVSLSDYIGKPVVVNFWASWCGYCKMEMPEYQKMYETYGKDVQFLMVDLTGGGSDSKDAADKVIADGGYTFPVFYDAEPPWPSLMAFWTASSSAAPILAFWDEMLSPSLLLPFLFSSMFPLLAQYSKSI